MEQTRLAIYQLSSLSPDAELLLSSAINKVFGEDVIAAERPAVLKDIHDKIDFSRKIGGEISPEFFASTRPVIIAGADNEKMAEDMLKSLMRELDSVRKGNRSDYAAIIGIPMTEGQQKLSKSIEQVAQGIVTDVEQNQREARLIMEPVKYYEEAESIRLTGNNVSMAYLAGMALQHGVSVNFTQNLENNQTTVTFRNPEEFSRVCMPAGNGEMNNFVYANIAAASRCVMTFDEHGKATGVEPLTAETKPEAIRKTCEYLTMNPKSEEASLAWEAFCEQVERDTADIRADISRCGSEAIAAPTAGAGGLPSSQIDYVERNYNIRTTYGAVAQPGRQQMLLRKLAEQARYMTLAIAMKNALDSERRAHEQRIREAAIKKEEDEKARKEQEELLRRQKEAENMKKQQQMDLLFASTAALTIAMVMGKEGKEWMRQMMQVQGIENLEGMYTRAQAEQLAGDGRVVDVVEKVKGVNRVHPDPFSR